MGLRTAGAPACKIHKQPDLPTLDRHRACHSVLQQENPQGAKAEEGTCSPQTAPELRASFRGKQMGGRASPASRDHHTPAPQSVRTMNIRFPAAAPTKPAGHPEDRALFRPGRTQRPRRDRRNNLCHTCGKHGQRRQGLKVFFTIIIFSAPGA